MQTLFDVDTVDRTTRRILNLRPESERQWGQMGVAHMLAHCTSTFEMAMGELETQPAPIAMRVLGRLIKPLVVGNDRPFRRNVRSLPELLPAGEAQPDFEHERLRLLAAMGRFRSNGAAGCTQRPHPFFGPVKPNEWAILMYKHLDHHLRQFGV